jgi:hypothetical protein
VIPLLILAIALSAGLATYEFSPKAHTWVDDHVRALRGAVAAHHDADTKLDAAQAAVDVHAVATQGSTAPGSDLLQHAWDSLKAAAQANAAAAVHSTTVLETAKTDQQKAVGAQSAAVVAARQKRIAAALATLGTGECDVHSYSGVTPAIRDAILAKLHSKNMIVTGDDPWDIDTKTHGVKLRAVWDPQTLVLKLIVVKSDFGVPCFMIWGELDPVLKGIIGS